MTQTARPQRQAKAKKFMVIIRPGFKKICADDACRAGMFNHILYNIAKQKQAGSDYWFSTGDAIWEETDRAWGKSKTLKEIKDLENAGIVARMRNPHNSWDQTRYFAFGEEQAKALHELCVKNGVCLASMRLPSSVTHLLNLTNAFCKSNKCICCNQQIDMLNLTNPFVETEIFPGDEVALQAGSESLYKDSYQDSNLGLITQRENSVPSQLSEAVVSAIAPTLSHSDTLAVSYSQETNTPSEQNKEKDEVASNAGYKQPTDVNTSSQQEKPKKQRSKQASSTIAEQPQLLPEKKGVELTDEEQRVFDLYCKLWFIAIPPKITPGRKEHCGKLAPFILSFADMESLEKVARKYLKSIGREVKVIEMGNLVNSLNTWKADQSKAPATPNQPAPTPEADMNKLVVWTRYKHQGAPIDHWYLYAVMPLSEALQYGYKADFIPPSYRLDIKTLLKTLAEGHRELTPEQKTELETAELRPQLHLVA